MFEESLLPDPPSWKFQFHPTIVPDDTVDKSVKHVGLFSQLTVDVKAATGSGENEIGCVAVAWHPAEEVAVKDILLFRFINE